MKHQYSPDSFSFHDENEKTLTFLKRSLLSKLSIKVRTDQLNILLKYLRPTAKTKVLDVGLSPNETLADTNLFEKLYPYPQRITAASVEDCRRLHPLYPKIKIVKVKPGQRLPFKDNQFDLVTSWATLEHVGNYDQQEFFLNELLRVGKQVFITTPSRGCFYEVHTGLLFIHWLPLKFFRFICRHSRFRFLAVPETLNPLFVNDIKKFKLRKRVNIYSYKTFNLVPTNLIITNTKIPHL